MISKQAFGKSLKLVRTSKGLTQEDFSDVSSRTYISSLERGIKSPTLEKIDDIAGTLKIHPLTLLTLTYLSSKKKQSMETLLEKVEKQVDKILEQMDEK